MTKIYSLMCAAFYSLTTLVTSARINTGNKDVLIETLLELISQGQTKTEQPLIPLKQWHRMKGSYKNEIKWNFHGSYDKALARQLLGVYDNNAFVTSCLVTNLVDAMKYGNITKPGHDQLNLAIEFLDNFHDKTKNYSTSLMSIWPQVYDNYQHRWRCEVDNLKIFYKLVNEYSESQLQTLLNIHGFRNLSKELNDAIYDLGMLLTYFELQTATDMDDSSVNLGLGTSLYQLSDQLTEEWTMWRNQNTNLTSVIDAVKINAYRPFSDDSNANTIDPRTYFYIRSFLDKAKTAGEDIALMTVWAQSIEELRHPQFMSLSLVFTGNEIDICVAANFLYGVTSSILSGLVSSDLLQYDLLLQQIYLNTTSLIAHTIQTNFSGRPDLAVVYYSSQFTFYHFVTRTLSILETAHTQGKIPIQVMESVYNILKDVTMKDVTDNILSQVKVEQDKFYLEDFLGNGDVTLDNKPLYRGEDRLFTTSLAANTLMSIWSIYNETSRKSYWRPETPASVVTTVTGCISWLTDHTLDGNYAPDNAFFVNSNKYYWGLPYWFPANRFEYLNRTTIEDLSALPNKTFVYAVTGYIEPDDYDAMLGEPHFGLKTPLTFNGFNNNPSNFIYWSSAPYTYSITLLAVSRFDNIVV